MNVIFYIVRSGVQFVYISAFLLRLVLGASIIDINTPVGKVSGIIVDAAPHVVQFLGIPFAEPPIGSLRWLPAKPKAPVDIINATAFGPSCSQFLTSFPQVYNTDVPGFLVQGPTSEDCLTLNIWASSGLRVRLPVIVWLYGGSFQTGGGDVPYQNPTQWVERTQEHIVVGIK